MSNKETVPEFDGELTNDEFWNAIRYLTTCWVQYDKNDLYYERFIKDIKTVAKKLKSEMELKGLWHKDEPPQDLTH